MRVPSAFVKASIFAEATMDKLADKGSRNQGFILLNQEYEQSSEHLE